MFLCFCAYDDLALSVFISVIEGSSFSCIIFMDGNAQHCRGQSAENYARVSAAGSISTFRQ